MPSAPLVDDEAEFELLDSIFADLDEATLSGFARGAAGRASASKSSKNNNLKPAQQVDTTRELNKKAASTSSKHALPPRTPLSTVRGNNLSFSSSQSPATAPVKTATAASSTKHGLAKSNVNNKVGFPHKTTSKVPSSAAARPFTRTSNITSPERVREKAPLPAKKHFAAPTQPPILQAQDADLLAGIDWSDEEGISLPSHSLPAKPASYKGKEKAQQLAVTSVIEVQSNLKPANYVPFSRRFTRCTVVNVTEKVVKDFRREKTLIVETERLKECHRVLLFDEWATTEVDIGDTVNVIGDFITPTLVSHGPSTSLKGSKDDLPTCTLSYSSENMLIVHPDTLISATRVSDAHYCRRKAVVQEKVRSSGESTPALVYGNLLHEVFQSCLLSLAASEEERTEDRVQEAFGLSKREEEIDRLLKVPKNIESLFAIDVEIDEARNHLREKSVTFAEFAKQFVGEHPKADSYLTDPRVRDADPLLGTRIAVSAVHDIEEDVWSPRLGLKGKVDASVQAVLAGPASATREAKEDTLVLPFEIKTGRNLSIMQHRAQTMLYTQMMADRYDRVIGSGLLYYTQMNSLIRVEPVRNELRGLLIARNEMARYLTPPPPEVSKRSRTDADPDTSMNIDDLSTNSIKPSDFATGPSTTRSEVEVPAVDEDEDAMWGDIEDVDLARVCTQPAPVNSERSVLPPAIDDAKSCKKCFSADACMLYRRAVDKVKYLAADDDPLQQAYEDRVGHMTDTQAEFFRSWEELITLEEREMLRFKNEIWTMSASEREKLGRCLANMIVDKSFSPERFRLTSTSNYRYTYRLRRSETTLGQLPTQLNPYSQAPPSSANDHANPQTLQSGHMSVGDPVVISAEPSVLALARGFIVDLCPEYIELGLDHSLACLPGASAASVPGQPIVFRVDKDELQAGMGRIRENLANMFYAKGDEKRRRLVVDLDAPRFADPDYKPLSSVERQEANLNEDQLHAVNKGLAAQDYTLILGMPGTGKTTTIVELIKALTARGKSVLLTSYTHSAVDNILVKIKDLDVGILRLGQLNRIAPSLAHLTLAGQDPPTSIAQLKQRLFSPQIVATTALGTDHPIFSRRKFDYCIVDEASQITLPTCLGPLRYADRFILVGDHNQLPPLVKNPRARKQGLEVSLFRRLSEAHPASMVYLRHQYRMNADIMAISNRLVYNNTLICGSADLAGKSMLVEPPGNDWDSLCSGCVTGPQACWVRDILDPSRHVVFVDTDHIPAREQRFGRLVQNETEAELVYQTTTALLKCSITEDKIGIIALYRQQIKLLQDLLHTHKGIEILTADKSQGRDKDCIIMSLTRSNTEKQVGDLIRDWRRLNVCFTRAKYKLIIIGSKTTLDEVPHMREFFDLATERGWIYALPAGALPRHPRPLVRPVKLALVPSAIVPPATAPIQQEVSSSSSSMALKRPSSSAPLSHTHINTTRGIGADRVTDLCSPSPEKRPDKIRKLTPKAKLSRDEYDENDMGNVLQRRKSLGSATNRVKKTDPIKKNRPLLRDILNCQ